MSPVDNIMIVITIISNYILRVILIFWVTSTDAASLKWNVSPIINDDLQRIILPRIKIWFVMGQSMNECSWVHHIACCLWATYLINTSITHIKMRTIKVVNSRLGTYYCFIISAKKIIRLFWHWKCLINLDGLILF